MYNIFNATTFVALVHKHLLDNARVRACQPARIVRPFISVYSLSLSSAAATPTHHTSTTNSNYKLQVQHPQRCTDTPYSIPMYL